MNSRVAGAIGAVAGPRLALLETFGSSGPFSFRFRMEIEFYVTCRLPGVNHRGPVGELVLCIQSPRSAAG